MLIRPKRLDAVMKQHHPVPEALTGLIILDMPWPGIELHSPRDKKDNGPHLMVKKSPSAIFSMPDINSMFNDLSILTTLATNFINV